MKDDAKLWELSEEIREVMDALEESGGELTDEIEERLEAVDEAFEGKVENTAIAIEIMQSRAAARKEQADKLKQAARALENSADSLKDYLHAQMQAAGVNSIEGDRKKVNVQRGSYSVRKTKDLSPDRIPAAYRKVKVRGKTLSAGDYDDAGELLEAIAEHSPTLAERVEVQADTRAILKEWKEAGDESLPDGFEVQQSSFVRIY